MDEDTMQILARVTTGVVAATTQSDTFRGWDMKMIMLIVSCIDVFVVLCYLLMIAHLKRRQEAYVEENDDAVVSLPDYSVMVWGIPKDADEDSMISHFTQFGELADCVIVKDLGKVMGPRIRRAKQLVYLKNMKIQAKYYEIKMYARGLRVQLKRIERYKKRILRTNAKIEKKLAEGFDAVCAFITFQEPEARAICVDSYNEQWSCCHKEKLKYRGKHKLRIKPAPEASDILWENVLRKNPLIQILRKFISFLVILVLCAAAVAVLVYAKDAASDSPPTVSCATVEPSVIAPSPALHCSAIWNLAGEDAYKVADSQARLSIDKFVDNVDINSCRNFISGAEWVRDMREFSAGNYSGAKNANLPAESSAWTGGFIADSYADECAALTCKKCFCLASVDVTTMLFDYVIGSSPDNTNFCKDIYDQMALETAVVLSTIAMTTATNMILMASAHTFSKFERHKTISATETNCAKYTFAALVVNQAIAPVIIYSYIEALEGFPILFQGQYGDFETAWYNKVMVTIMSTAMVNIVAFPLGAALPNIAAAMLRSLTGCCAPSQKKLNEIYAPAEFSLARRYGQMLCGLFYTIVFLCAAPPLAPLAAILFGAMYITDKWLLLKFSKRPPMYDHKLNTFFLKTAPYAGWVHLAIASWAFGYHEIPSYIVDPGGIAEKIGFSSVSDAADAASDSQSDDNLNGAPGQFDILARLVRANALVPFLMFVIVTVALFFTGLIESIASFFGNACVGEEKVDEVPPFDELVFFGDSRYDEPIPEGEINNKLSGLRSYRLEDNPEYMQLFPDVLAADGAESLNRKKRPTALGETAAPERQNMTPGA
jgi:DNA-directed RNA polymerase II subunit RPB7